MAFSSPFSVVEQGDIAFLEQDDIAYRCCVWLRMGAVTEGENEIYRGLRVEAAVYVEQPHGQSVLISRQVVRTPASGEYVDMPRVVALGDTFHVHWIEYDPTETTGDPQVASGRDLHRATFDVLDSPYAWTHQGSITTSYLHLYDVASEGSGSDYIIAHASTATAISVRRVNGDDWTTTWTAYEKLIDGCNRCHMATEHGFIKIVPAQGEPPFNQTFKP